MDNTYNKEKEVFQRELTARLKKPLSYIKEKGYDLSDKWIARYQEFFDKQAGYREGKNSFEELRAIPKEVMMAARCWAQHETNKRWDAERAREQAEQDCINRIGVNLSTVDKTLSRQRKENHPLQRALAELKEDIDHLAALVRKDHHYIYMVNGLNEDEWNSTLQDECVHLLALLNY